MTFYNEVLITYGWCFSSSSASPPSPLAGFFWRSGVSGAAVREETGLQQLEWRVTCAAGAAYRQAAWLARLPDLAAKTMLAYLAMREQQQFLI